MSLENEKDRVPIIYSWVAIIILLVLLWPVGAVFMWKRGKVSRKTGLNIGLYYMILGAVFMLGAIIAGYFLGDDFMAMCFIYAVSGVVFARMGYEEYKKGNIYRKIILEVEEEGTLMIPMLADEVGMPEIDVIKNINKMVERNLLHGYELSHNNKRLIKK